MQGSSAPQASDMLNSQSQFSRDEGSTLLCSLATMRKERCRSNGHVSELKWGDVAASRVMLLGSREVTSAASEAATYLWTLKW